MGYIGQKMSERAAMAYEEGIMPKSKWTKSAILEAIASLRTDAEMFSQLTRDELFDAFFVCSEWHHTGKYFSQTYFYALEEEEVLAATDETIETIIQCREPRKKKEPVAEERAVVEYVVWTGTRNHPKANRTEDVGTIRNGVFISALTGERKLTSGKRFFVLNTLTEEEYTSEIEKRKQAKSETNKGKKGGKSK